MQDVQEGTPNTGGQAPPLTIADAARALGVSTKTIRRRIESGQLEATRVAMAGGGWSWVITSALVLPAGFVPTPIGDARPADAETGLAVREAPAAVLAALVERLDGLDQAVRAVVDLAEKLAVAEGRAVRAEVARDSLNSRVQQLVAQAGEVRAERRAREAAAAAEPLRTRVWRAFVGR